MVKAGTACLQSEAAGVLRKEATVEEGTSLVHEQMFLRWQGDIAGSPNCMQRCYRHIACMCPCWRARLRSGCTDAEKPPKTKRGIAQPREGFMIEDVKAQTVTPIPYDIVKEGIQT